MPNIVNCLSQTIHIKQQGKKEFVIEPELHLDIKEEIQEVYDWTGLKIYSKKITIEKLPPEQRNIYYVVNKEIAKAYPDRKDLLCPFDITETSPRVIYCNSLLAPNI